MGLRRPWPEQASGRVIDPLGFDAGDSNLYRYVANAPVLKSDPSGFQTWYSGGEHFNKDFRYFAPIKSIPLGPGTLDIGSGLVQKDANGETERFYSGVFLSYVGKDAQDVRWIQFMRMSAKIFARDQNGELVQLDPPLVVEMKGTAGGSVVSNDNKYHIDIGSIKMTKTGEIVKSPYYFDPEFLYVENKRNDQVGIGNVSKGASWVFDLPYMGRSNNQVIDFLETHQFGPEVKKRDQNLTYVGAVLNIDFDAYPVLIDRTWKSNPNVVSPRATAFGVVEWHWTGTFFGSDRNLREAKVNASRETYGVTVSSLWGSPLRRVIRNQVTFPQQQKEFEKQFRASLNYMIYRN